MRTLLDSSDIFSIFRTVPGNMAFLLTLVACLVLVWIASDCSRGLRDGRTRCCQAIPGHVIGASTAIALHGGKCRSVQSTSGRRSAGSKASTSSSAGAGSCDVAKTPAVVTLLVRALDPQTRALRLDMANTPARIALLGSDCARLRARRGLVAGLAAVVAKPLLRGTILRNVS